MTTTRHAIIGGLVGGGGFPGVDGGKGIAAGAAATTTATSTTTTKTDTNTYHHTAAALCPIITLDERYKKSLKKRDIAIVSCGCFWNPQIIYQQVRLRWLLVQTHLSRHIFQPSHRFAFCDSVICCWGFLHSTLPYLTTDVLGPFLLCIY